MTTPTDALKALTLYVEQNSVPRSWLEDEQRDHRATREELAQVRIESIDQRIPASQRDLNESRALIERLVKVLNEVEDKLLNIEVNPAIGADCETIRSARAKEKDMVFALRRFVGEALKEARVPKTPDPVRADWNELRPGDVVSLLVFDPRWGYEREERLVVKVDNFVTFRDDNEDREYTLERDDIDWERRDPRLVARGRTVYD